MLGVRDLEGLRQVRERALLQRFLGRRELVVRGHHDDGNALIQALDVLEHLQPAHAGHVDVEENQVGTALEHRREALDSALRRLDFVAILEEIAQE